MNQFGEQTLRGLRAEWVRSAGGSPLWIILVPAAVLLPAAITFVIAGVAEQFAGIPGQIGIQQVTTSNAAYWVISITVVLTAVAAGYGQSQEFNRGGADYVHAVLPRPSAVFLGKWLFYGAVGVIVSAALLVVVLVALPRVAPLVYGQVSVGDPVARRLLWTVPTLAFFAAALGTGVGALIRSPAAAVGLLLFWVYVMETAVGFLPGGVSLQRFMPFLNAVYGTGQDIVLYPPWGPNPAMVYACGVCVLLFAIGLARVTLNRRSARTVKEGWKR